MDDFVKPVVTLIIILAALSFCKFILKWSATETMKWVMHEFKDLLRGDYSAGAINAMGVLAAIILAITALVSPKVDKFLSLGLTQTPLSNSPVTLLSSIFMISMLTLVCVHLIIPKK